MNKTSNLLKYFIIAVFFWVVVDYTTAFNPDLQRWLAHMPVIWLFYLGYPLLFAWLIYRRKWQGKKLFLAMLAGIFIVEIIFSGNIRLFAFPDMFLFIPAALAIYSFITYTPKWIVENQISQNKKKIILMTIIWILISLVTFTSAG